MITYELKINFSRSNGFESMTSIYGEKELNKALNQIVGLLAGCLIEKKLALHDLSLDKIVIFDDNKKCINLVYIKTDEFSYRYIESIRKEEIKNEKNINDDVNLFNYDVYS